MHRQTKSMGKKEISEEEKVNGGEDLRPREVNGLTTALEEEGEGEKRVVHRRRSADIRGRRRTAAVRIMRVESAGALHAFEDEEREWEEEREWVPPHEYLARSARSQSVVEGVGRTLKGRDLSRVRDAVWSQTGFFG